MLEWDERWGSGCAKRMKGSESGRWRRGKCEDDEEYKDAGRQRESKKQRLPRE